MAGQLAAFGYTITGNPAEADLWVLNSCTVKNPSENSFLGTISKANQAGKKVVLAGCVPQGDRQLPSTGKYSVLGVQQIDRVVEVVEETLKGHVVQLLGQKNRDGRRTAGARLDLPKIRKNPLVEIIPINTGCLNHCTYCKTKHSRGDLVSYSPEEIVARVRSVVQEGVTEIWLTSEDTGTYGRDIGSSLPELLWAVVAELTEGVMMRVGMTNPPYILEHLEEMARILRHPRVYSFLHIPVQAGSDRVLNAMKREYTMEDFEHVVTFLRERVPGMTIATDIICGFPGETEEDFDRTMALLERFRFPVLYISQFYSRPGTPAARMEKVPQLEIKRRSREVTRLFESYHPYTHELSMVQSVLVTDVTGDGLQYVAHNKSYEQVLISREE